MVETRGGRRFAVFFFLAAFLVLLLGHWLRPASGAALSVAAPFASVISGVAGGIGDTVTAVVDAPGLRAQNAVLKRNNALLIKRNVLYQETAHENQILRRMTGFADRNNHMDLLPARVIGNDPNDPISQYILINKGTRDGLRNDMTVVDQNGFFVGTTTQMTGNAAKVLLMTSPSSSVGAIDLSTRAGGLVQGQFGSRPEFADVFTRDRLRKNDLVVTSGQFNLFPRTILLGQVVSVSHQGSAIFQSAVIQPAADFQNLEMVQVVRNWNPQYPGQLINGH
jgi:rod shape-determining protein MreC